MEMPAQKIDRLLATALFERMGASVAMAGVGVLIVLYAHWGVGALFVPLIWALCMAAVFVLRLAVARYGLQAFAAEQGVDRYLNVMALLYACTGLGWAAILFVFDTEVPDHRFNVRLMILTATLTFSLASMAEFKRIFLSYLLAISVPVLAFVAQQHYIPQRETLFVSAVVFIAMVTFLTYGSSRRMRQGASDHLAALSFSSQLQCSLSAETELRNAMSVLALTDELTQVLNRRAVLDALSTEIARCLRLGSPLAVVMVDVDHFKHINDTFGHARGDEVLRAVVAALQKGLRETDMIGRFGGEEFLLILPALSQERAALAAQRLRQQVEQMEIALPQCIVHITISMGLAAYRAGDTVEQLIARADAALYQAKGQGRNRLVQAP